MSEDKELMESVTDMLKSTLYECYLIESIASFKLENLIEQAIIEAERIIEEGEI